MKWKKISLVLVLVLSTLLVLFSGCIEEDYTCLINEEFNKANAKFIIAYDAIDRGDYTIAKQKVYDARFHIDTAYRHYHDIQVELTESERIHWRTVFELYRIESDLIISEADWYIAEDGLIKTEDERFLTELEFHVRRTEELAKVWERYANTLGFIQRTQPDIGITDIDINFAREQVSILEIFAEDDRITINELKDLMPEYIPIDDRVITPIIVISPVSEEIIPSDLARFFDGFDVDRNRGIDLGEAQNFFYWVEENIIYRYDCEKAYLEPDFSPGFPVGDERPGIDYWQTPHTTWMERAGDCEDMAILQVAFYNHFGISAYMATVSVKIPGRLDHAIAIVWMGGTPEEFVDFLGDLVYYELEYGYYMLVDNAYSDSFGYLSGGLKEGQFTIVPMYDGKAIFALEEAIERHRHIREAM